MPPCRRLFPFGGWRLRSGGRGDGGRGSVQFRAFRHCRCGLPWLSWRKGRAFRAFRAC
ncbi:hypothetical protein Y88_2366 [Novosphingobium nitrogenifigens DSM 19370]|uniref:Uncharacterized protein n=1 Tax=Novosphingobium nitrogenifigens DSM 19370 TaxID=983920 RepID=F1Z6E5_9SPHN|nr:hypothetical protein Y88_2366 [Novosphingobium nitrogenifigens DSM 19370]